MIRFIYFFEISNDSIDKFDRQTLTQLVIIYDYFIVCLKYIALNADTPEFAFV